MKKLTLAYIEQQILKNVDFPRKKTHWIAIKKNFGKTKKGLIDKDKEIDKKEKKK